MTSDTQTNTKGPQFIRFLTPIIEVLREIGGSGTSSEVTDKVIERLAIPDEELAIVLKSGQRRVPNQVHWARMYLVNGGLIDSSKRGVWTLTDEGRKTNLEEFDSLEFFKRVHGRHLKKKSLPQPEPVSEDDDNGDPEIDEELDLLDVLRSLSPSGFERICQRLLRENGFQQVQVTGKSGDGGIDGIGILQINKFVSFRNL